MKTPNFWRKKNLISYSLVPLSFFYKIATLWHKLVTKPIKINKPIICIGNFTVGGAGKTPIAIQIGKILCSMDIQFSYLGHGYKSKNQNLILVDEKLHDSAQVGDEAILLSQISHTFIAKNRVFAAKQIAKMPDEQLIIMDDGLQNFSLKKDFSIAVIDGGYGFGNNLIFPAGPLRQNYKKGSKNIDIIMIIGDDKFNHAQSFKGKKVMVAKTIIVNLDKFKGKPLFAFCGIGRPSKFFDTLKEDCNVVHEVAFSDHYNYQEKDIQKLLNDAYSMNAHLVTTKKDWVRLDQIHKDKIQYLDIAIEFEVDDALYLKDKLKELISI